MLENSVEIQGILDFFCQKSGKASSNLVVIRNTSTGDIAGHAWCYSTILFALPFIEVGIVDYTGFLATCAPRECAVTLRTPHLITTLDLRDDSSATWAWTTILGEKLRSGNVIWITGVLGITRLSLNLVAVWAGPLGT
jgi:hypothetical protein